MKLQQLKYLIAIVDNGLNITTAAEALFTSQPGVSKQIKLLEDELSIQLFERKGKSLAGLTSAGVQVVERARRLLAEAENIKQLASELAGHKLDELTIATTPTQARYVLPDMLHGFQQQYSSTALRLHQGTSEQISEQVLGREADFAIASGDSELFENLVTFPMYSWERIVVVPKDHPLTRISSPTLEDIAQYPIISYTYSFSDESSLGKVFEREDVEPNVVFTAQDPDVIKNFVRKGMGIGIVACMAYDERADSDLVSIKVHGLFPTLTTWVGFRKDRFLSDHMYEFLKLMVPGIDRERIALGIDNAGLAEDDPARSRSNVIPLPKVRPVQRHPTFGLKFTECCDGFNL